MKKRFFSSLGVVAMVASLLAIAAPAQAAPVPFDVEQFMPNDTAWGTCGTPPECAPDFLSDKFDGTDSLAHLTVVATSDTDYVIWYACPTAVNAAGGITEAELATCNVVIGRDDSGRTPAASGFSSFTPVDEAYDVQWDIPGALDGQRRDILALACIGPGSAPDPQENATPANCTFDLEENIFLEDAQTGVAQNQTTAGEFTKYTTGTLPADCPGGPNCVAAQKDFPHGSPVPNDGFTFYATTSSDASNLRWGIDEGADAQNEPNNIDFQGACDVVTTFTDFIRWQCVVPGGSVPDNKEMALHIVDNSGASAAPGTSGYCDSANASDPAFAGAHDFCLLDVHYIVSSARAASTSGASFVNVGPGGLTPAAGTCAPADTEETNQLGDAHDVRFCVKDQFGDPFVGPVTFESTGPEGSGFTVCFGGGGTLHDHDADGRNEHCHTTTAADGTATARINNFTDDFETATPGTQTVTACTDPQSTGGTVASPPAGHGCADNTTVRATVTKNWVTQPSIIELVFAPRTGTYNAQDVCLTGDKFKENVVGETDTLLACTFDSSGNFVSTQPADNGRLQWFIAPSGGGELTATRFKTPPPNETGADGTTTATLEAFRQGNDIITVCGQDDPGENNFGTGNCASVQKRVTQGGGPNPQCSDGVDNDGDGQTDFPADPQCTSADDDTEAGGPDPEVRLHARTIEITRMRHVFLPNKPRPALLIKGVVTAPSSADCAHNVPVKVQIRAGGEWITRKTDTTNSNGVFKVLIRDIQAKYRARATRFEIADPAANVVHVCQKASDERRHGH